MGHNYTCHNYIGHNYIDHNYIMSVVGRGEFLYLCRDTAAPPPVSMIPRFWLKKKKKGSSMRRDPGRMLMCSPVSSFCPPVDVNNSTSILRNLWIFDPSASP